MIGYHNTVFDMHTVTILGIEDLLVSLIIISSMDEIGILIKDGMAEMGKTNISYNVVMTARVVCYVIVDVESFEGI